MSGTTNTVTFQKHKESANHVSSPKTTKVNVLVSMNANFVVREVFYTFRWTSQIMLTYFACWSMDYGNLKTPRSFSRGSTLRMRSKMFTVRSASSQTHAFTSANVATIMPILYVLSFMGGVWSRNKAKRLRTKSWNYNAAMDWRGKRTRKSEDSSSTTKGVSSVSVNDFI